VVEIGPFLGGTSRAIALGMRANPRYQSGRLLTYDRFQFYYGPTELKEFLDPLVKKGVLKQASMDKMGAEASFMNIFKEIHQAHDYGRILDPIHRPLPETVEEVAEGGPWFALENGIDCSAFFVDGCKSWYGTKYFMMECCRVAQPGACFIFQDYLMHTCFWLPAFVACFPDRFRLVCHVDHTYAFQLVKPLAPEHIAATYPDQAESLSPETVKKMFDAVRSYADRRGDREAILKHALQYGAALAYIGQPDAARKLFAEVAKSPMAAGFEGVVQKASRTPTYRPNKAGGEPVLL
jgi:hypothetical protein